MSGETVLWASLQVSEAWVWPIWARTVSLGVCTLALGSKNLLDQCPDNYGSEDLEGHLAGVSLGVPASPETFAPWFPSMLASPLFCCSGLLAGGTVFIIVTAPDAHQVPPTVYLYLHSHPAGCFWACVTWGDPGSGGKVAWGHLAQWGQATKACLALQQPLRPASTGLFLPPAQLLPPCRQAAGRRC